MRDKVTIEIWTAAGWQVCADVCLTGHELQGPGAATEFEYVTDYVLAHLGGDGLPSVSVRYPIGFEPAELDSWPPFLLDLLPAGAQRRFWEVERGIPRGAQGCWQLLRQCVMNPPGNLRIAEAAEELVPVEHSGFARSDVVLKREGFLEYARHNGAPIGGSSGAQGDAPKFLLARDRRDRWHASGAIRDEEIEDEWIVKFPRGPRDVDRAILHAESVYYSLAEEAGCRVQGPLAYEDGCLFIKRFDRQKRGGLLERHGLEGLSSALGFAEFGASCRHEEILQCIRTFSTQPEEDLEEWLRRDMLNVFLGNTDNHLRNSAFLKTGRKVALSPLYDFAPMALDPEGILRVCRWREHETGFPVWHDLVRSHYGSDSRIHDWVEELLNWSKELPDRLNSASVAAEIVEYLRERIPRVRRANGQA